VIVALFDYFDQMTVSIFRHGVCRVGGPDSGYVRQFLSGVVGAEVASLAMTPDDRSLFASIIRKKAARASTHEPLARWRFPQTEHRGSDQG
jgi:secreted PhoX family phosphatase